MAGHVFFVARISISGRGDSIPRISVQISGFGFDTANNVEFDFPAFSRTTRSGQSARMMMAKGGVFALNVTTSGITCKITVSKPIILRRTWCCLGEERW